MMPFLFADSNVLIEAFLIPQSAAYVVLEMVARGVFNLATPNLCIEDTEDVIMEKLEKNPAELDQVIRSWETLKTDTRLVILPDPNAELVKSIYDQYIGVMRHKADIPVLAAALSMEPRPQVILSGNREHFNDAVANRCGIHICSCTEFIEFISQTD